jgi:hypothetical protein
MHGEVLSGDTGTDCDSASLDATVQPPYLTLGEGEIAAVSLLSTVKPERIASSNPSVATAEVVDYFDGVFLGSIYTVRITGNGPGTAFLTSVAKGAAGPPARLEVDVTRQRTILYNAYFVQDSDGVKTDRNISTFLNDFFNGGVPDVYVPANIEFHLHNSTDAQVNLSYGDFAVPNQSDAHTFRVFGVLSDFARRFDPTLGRLHIFSVRKWLARDVYSLTRITDVLGTTLHRVIIIEDLVQGADAAFALAHEIGHALGLRHNTHQDALMYETNQFGGKRLFKNEYRTITVRR